MSLDQNLFTLHFQPNKDDPSVVDLVDPAGTAYYRKQRITGNIYKVEVYDPMSESLLATATGASATAKVKTVELCNPTMKVELKYSGTLSFRWSFHWEAHEFEWKREECYMLRKPDPPVLVAVTKESASLGRGKASSVQILDYNLNRFDIDDRKGLEIVMLTALLTFQDGNDSHYITKRESTKPTSPDQTRTASALPFPAALVPVPQPIPSPISPSLKPEPITGPVDKIPETQTSEEQNEITVEQNGLVDDYAARCANLLRNDLILFVTIRSAAAEQVPKVLQVLEQTKRIRHKEGLDEDEELHQYVLYDTVKPVKKGPKRINLDDFVSKSKNKYQPPNSLVVHLSKIPMPELQPKASTPEKSAKELKDGQSSKAKMEDSNTGEASAKTEDDVKRHSKHKPSGNNASISFPTPNKLTRPSRSPSPHRHIQPHEVHPHQPSPSPSQLNNPMIYSAPPIHPPQSVPLHPPQSEPFHPPRPFSYPPPSLSSTGPPPPPTIHTSARPPNNYPGPSGPPQAPWYPPPRPTSMYNSNGPSLYGSFAPPLQTPNPIQNSFGSPYPNQQAVPPWQTHQPPSTHPFVGGQPGPGPYTQPPLPPQGPQPHPQANMAPQPTQTSSGFFGTSRR